MQHALTYAGACVFFYIFLFVCLSMYTHTYVCVYIHTHVRMHACVQMQCKTPVRLDGILSLHVIPRVEFTVYNSQFRVQGLGLTFRA